MKNIIYFIIASLIYCTLTSVSIISKDDNKTILLKPIDKNVTTAGIEQSATIISARLKVYGIEKPDVTPVPEKGQIKVHIPDNYTLSEIEGLLTLKGDFAFYETYTKDEVSDLMKGDNQLFLLLNSDKGVTPSGSRIGCINVEKRSPVNAYLKSIKNPENCKFIWSFRGVSSDESLRCLYALKTDKAGKALLTRSDVETVKPEQDKDNQSFKISIIFKKSGAGLWADATRKNMNRSIAIVVDNNVFYTPVVRSVIDKGVCEITGNMTLKDVDYFVAITNNSPLPTAFELVR